MSFTTSTITTHTHSIEIDGVEYETTFPADEYITPKVTVEDGKTVITYASLDDYYPYSPIEDDCSAEFREFDSASHRDSWAEDEQESGRSVFFVNHHEHSLSNFSVIGDMRLIFVCDYCEANFVTREAGEEGVCPEMADNEEWNGHDLSVRAASSNYRAGWDDRPSGVISLSEDFDNPLEVAESLMEAYTYWANGEVYSVIEETYDSEGAPLDYDCVGGYFGPEHAASAIAEGF